MHFAKKAALGLLTILLPLWLLALAIDGTIVGVAGNPNQLKQIVADSGVYNDLVDDLLKKAKPVKAEGQSLSLNNPYMARAAKKTFSPSFLQKNVEAIVDGTYNWLDGKAKLPDFKIDLDDARESFAVNIATEIKVRAAKLPTCSGNQPAQFDPLKSKCLPAGLSPGQAAARVERQMLNGRGFIDDSVVTVADLKNAKDLFSNQLADVPDYYQKAKSTSFILGGLVILTAVGIFALSDNHRRGLRRSGWIIFSAGLLVTILAWAVNYMDQRAIRELEINNAAVAGNIKAIVAEIIQSLDKLLWVFGVAYILLGALVVVTAIRLERRASTRPATK